MHFPRAASVTGQAPFAPLILGALGLYIAYRGLVRKQVRFTSPRNGTGNRSVWSASGRPAQLVGVLGLFAALAVFKSLALAVGLLAACSLATWAASLFPADD